MRRGTMLVVGILVMSLGPVVLSADFDGDGTGEIAIFRSASGLWAVRYVTRLYFGASGDLPVPGDYRGDGTDALAIFRASSGLWAVRGVTRTYFGGSGDQPKPGDYNGDGTFDAGIFRASSGLWAARGVTRTYFGGSADLAISPGRAGGSGVGLLWTGQTDSYRSGDDGDYRRGIAFSYQTSDPAGTGEIVTRDNVTGLMWASDGNAKGCNFGNWSIWTHAIEWAEELTFAGYSDWRLPNIRELHSIVTIAAKNPPLNTAYFSHTDTEEYNYWSSSSFDEDTDWAWFVEFNTGYLHYDEKIQRFHTRAVRGGK